MHVSTDEGIEGMCTVGDVRYTALAVDDLEQLRLLVIGEDPFDRERLYARLRRATRHMFTGLGWFGAFDNCLWDIAGKAAGLPVSVLVGRVRDAAPAYYNIRGDSIEAVIADTRAAIAAGFPAIKDHFHRSGRENASWCEAVRSAVGDAIDLMHDAAGCDYSFAEAADLGQALERLEYRWFEEPLPDRHQERLAELCRRLDIPVLSAETLMNDVDLSAQWLISGTTDLLRANARHGLTSALKLSHLAELHGTNIEFNGPGGSLESSMPTWCARSPLRANTSTSRAGRGAKKARRSGCSTLQSRSRGRSPHPEGPGGERSGIGRISRRCALRCFRRARSRFQ